MSTNNSTGHLIRAMLLLCCLLPTSSVFPQSQEAEEFRAYSRLGYWRVDYTVEIKGKGRVEPEPGSGGPEIEWTVNRVYTGSAMMDNLKGLYYRGKQTQKMSIHDKVTRTSDPTCDEYTVETETWDYEGGGRTEGLGHLEFFETPGWERMGSPPPDWPMNKFTGHSIVLAVDYVPFTTVKGLPKDEPRLLVYQKETVYHPKKTVKREPAEIRPNALNLRVPNVPDWIASSRLGSGVVKRDRKPFPDLAGGPFEFAPGTTPGSKTYIRATDKNNNAEARKTYTISPIPRMINGRFEFDSGELPIPESLLEGIDTRDKATAWITYTLTPAGCESTGLSGITCDRVRPMIRKDGKWEFVPIQ